MAVDKSAVRKGTRWSFMAKEVEVLEVTDGFVVYCGPHLAAEVASTKKFTACARDPATAEHDQLLEFFGSWGPGTPVPSGERVHQAISYLLARLGPPAPLNVLPPPPADPAPVIVEAPRDEPVEGPCDYAVAMPAMEPLPEDEPRFAKKRRFTGL